MFYDILERKNDFLGCKQGKFEKSKNRDFSKGVSPCFWSQGGHFSNLFSFANIGKENVFYDILERKNDFLGEKNTKFEKSKNRDSSLGVSPWFWSKISHFPNFFWEYMEGKCVLRYSGTKKRLSRR